MSRGLNFWPIYLAPTLIAWYRSRKGKRIFFPVGVTLFYNVIFGWTIVMWLICLASAFGLNPIGALVFKFFGNRARFPGTGNTGPTFAPNSSGASVLPCSMCGGSGTTSCSSCGGRGSWYNAPQTESGVAQLQTCFACTSTGRLRCPSCGGSGRAPGLI